MSDETPKKPSDLLQGEDPIGRVLLSNLQMLRGYDIEECRALAPAELSQHDLMRLLFLVRQLQNSVYPKQLTELHRSPFGHWADISQPWLPRHHSFYRVEEVWVGWVHNPYTSAPPLDPEGAEVLWMDITESDTPAKHFLDRAAQGVQPFYVVWRVNAELVVGSTTVNLIGSGLDCKTVANSLSALAVREIGRPIEFRQVNPAKIRLEQPSPDASSIQMRRLPHAKADFDWIP